MKSIKEIILLLTPPILHQIVLPLYRRLKKLFSPNYRAYLKEKEKKIFSGVYTNINEIRDENPWIQESWIELSKQKLEKMGGGEQLFKNDSFIPKSKYFGGYQQLPCFIINLLSQRNPCNILDFGGGTGLIYFVMFPYLFNPENVIYHVVDQNSELSQIGKKHADQMGIKTNIIFHDEMPKKDDIQLDVLFMNTCLQYIYDYSSLLVTLLKYNPQYVILTRTLAGDMKTYLTCQNLFGYSTPCVFINIQEIINIFLKNGFKLIFKSPNNENFLEEIYDDNIPKHLLIHNSVNLIFRRSEDESPQLISQSVG